jgi:hypothetical protein
MPLFSILLLTGLTNMNDHLGFWEYEAARGENVRQYFIARNARKSSKTGPGLDLYAANLSVVEAIR